jgi:hypothetical protein
MTSLFALIFMGLVGTAEARRDHQSAHHNKEHVERHRRRHKPRRAKVFWHHGHKHYRHAGFVWRWVPRHRVRGHLVRGHWEITYRF